MCTYQYFYVSLNLHLLQNYFMHLMRSYLNAFSNNANIFPCRCSILMEIVRFVYRTYRLRGTYSIVTISWTRDGKFPVVGTCTTAQLLGTMRCRLRQSTSDSSCKRRGRRNYTSRCTCSFLEPWSIPANYICE